MRKPTAGDPEPDRVLLPLLLAVLLLLSPARHLWARQGSPWWLLFVLWAALIGLVFLGLRRGGGGADEP